MLVGDKTKHLLGSILFLDVWNSPGVFLSYLKLDTWRHGLDAQSKYQRSMRVPMVGLDFSKHLNIGMVDVWHRYYSHGVGLFPILASLLQMSLNHSLFGLVPSCVSPSSLLIVCWFFINPNAPSSSTCVIWLHRLTFTSRLLADIRVASLGSVNIHLVWSLGSSWSTCSTSIVHGQHLGAISSSC